MVGAGIVGLATAWRLYERSPTSSIVVVERAAEVGRGQTGRNSGVLHSGLAYRPGSAKARLCVRGKAAMEAFCVAEGVPVRRTGKVIVATTPAEAARLGELAARGLANGVPCEVIGPDRLAEIEPHARGLGAVHVPGAGIVSFGAVARRMRELLVERGVSVRTGAAVEGIVHMRGRVVVETAEGGAIEARCLVACAGLASDRIARLAGTRPPMRIVPVRGAYRRLRPSAEHHCQGLIYPVPDPALPFLGVHLTRLIDGGVECGPTAMLAPGRSGAPDAGDLAAMAMDPGFWRLLVRYRRVGLGEAWRSLRGDAFLGAVRRLVPEVAREDLLPAPAGVRAQAVDRAGRLVDDFVFVEQDRAVHVCNAPSPAATAALAIGEVVAERAAARLV